MNLMGRTVSQRSGWRQWRMDDFSPLTAIRRLHRSSLQGRTGHMEQKLLRTKQGSSFCRISLAFTHAESQVTALLMQDLDRREIANRLSVSLTRFVPACVVFSQRQRCQASLGSCVYSWSLPGACRIRVTENGSEAAGQTDKQASANGCRMYPVENRSARLLPPQ